MTSFVLLGVAPSALADSKTTLESLETQGSSLSGLLGLSLGTFLDPDATKESLALESQLAYQVNKQTSLSGSMLLNRPLSPYENFELPKLSLALSHQVESSLPLDLVLVYTAQLRMLSRLGSDGLRLRNYFSLLASGEPFRGAWVRVSLRPFVQFNEYAQTLGGTSLPSWGFLESLEMAYNWGRLRLELSLALAQTKATVWSNTLSFGQVASMQLAPSWRVGLSHELVTSRVDSETGFYQSVRLFDGRESYVSAFIEATL